MLVKVKGVTEDGKDDWLYIGEVEELQISDVIYERALTATEAVKENVDVDYWMCSSKLFDKDRAYRRILCTKRDGHMVSVVFNTVAYICNDSGKTIEKHVVNEV